MSESIDTLNIVAVLRRQAWLIIACVVCGLGLAVVYWVNAPLTFESTAKVLVSQKDPRSSDSRSGQTEDIVNEDVLANHMEVVRSRHIVETALRRRNLETLPSILAELDSSTPDPVDYVIDQLQLTKGGDGGARDARSLQIAFQHKDPQDAQLILTAIVQEYQAFLGAQLESAMSAADLLIRDAQSDVEEEMNVVQEEYVQLRTSAPVMFQGGGSSNVYLDQFRRLNDELLELTIQESTINTRLARIRQVLAEREKQKQEISASEAEHNSDQVAGEDLEMLALIDSESLERLGVFAGLQMSSARSAEFQAAQPARLEEARTRYSHLLKLMSEKQRLQADFGDSHPKVMQLQEEIDLVKKFTEDKAEETSLAFEMEMTPELLMKAYIGFLQHDIASIMERKNELTVLAAKAESEAKSLVEFELKDKILQDKIDRKQQLFEGIVQQLRDLNMASGLSGYVHVLLEAPRYGEKVWPKLSLCVIGGVFLGLFGGLVLAIANDQLDRRFRSFEEIDEVVGLPVFGRVGALSRATGVKALVSNAESMEGEAFRSMRTVLLSDVKSGKIKVLLTSSSLSGDGKSTIVANLATTFAQLKLNVLIIDADMRRPNAHKLLGVDQNDGLADVLSGDLDPMEAIRQTQIEYLSVMPAGNIPSHPSELLESQRFDDLLELLREDFQLILIDVGPVLAVTDPCVISKKSDGTLLVVRPSKDTKDHARDAVSRLRSINAPLIGCIVNTFGSTEFEQPNGYYGEYEKAYRKARKNSSNGQAASSIVAPRLQDPASQTEAEATSSDG